MWIDAFYTILFEKNVLMQTEISMSAPAIKSHWA